MIKSEICNNKGIAVLLRCVYGKSQDNIFVSEGHCELTLAGRRIKKFEDVV